MRTKTLLLTAALGAAGVAAAMAQDPVFSVNAVGYVNKNLTSGFNLIANPLINGDNTLNTIIPTAPNLATVSQFAGGGFTTSVFITGVGWSPNLTLPPGEGFFVNVAADTTVTFIGEVPQGDASNMTVPAGLSLIASPVPQAGSLDDMGFPGAAGTVVNVFDKASGGFPSSPFIPGVGFLPAVNVEVGQGFFVTSTAGGEWNRDFSVNN